MSRVLLILGGTAEAAELARQAAALPGLEVVTSLAGRTEAPATLAGRVRVGGFGGAEGLARWLRDEGVTMVVDATHPFAARISAHAQAACAAAGLPLLALVRPPWPRHQDDCWIEADSMADAAARLPALGRRAFLAVGRQELAAFEGGTGVWFLVRLLRPEPLPLPEHTVVIGRGPFGIEAEIDLLRRHRIEVVVTKASGGAATAAKVAAARALALPVLMVRRPPRPATETVETVTGALAWILARNDDGRARTGGIR